MYKSHQVVCSFIEVVQNTYGTASPSSDAGLLGDTGGRGGGQWGPAWPQGGQELAGTQEREDPGVLVPKGRGWASGRAEGKRLPLRQGARGSHHVQRWAMPPEGMRGWESSVPATLAPKQPLPHLVPGARSPAPATSPGPSPGAGEGAAPTQQHGQTGNRRDVLEGSA